MKAKFIVLVICIFAVSLLQSTVLEYLEIYNVKPNLFLIFIVSVALLNGNLEGSVTGLLCGLAQDMLSGKQLGFYALLGLYLGLAVGSVNKRLYRENILVILFFSFTSTLVYEWMVYFFSTFFRGDFTLLYPLQHKILPEAVYNSAVSIIVYIAVIKTNDKLTKVDKLARKY